MDAESFSHSITSAYADVPGVVSMMSMMFVTVVR